MSPLDIPKPAVTTQFGIFEIFRMSFGLKGASSTLQRYIYTTYPDVCFVDPYIYDLIVASETEERHIFDLEQVF